MTKKKVLILSASIGTGHTQAARAIEEYVKTIPEECDVEHVDFLSNDILSIDNIVKETYIKILDVFPLLYDLMYYSFPAGAAALLKRQHRLNIPLVGVITDFAIHQLWVYPQIDVYCVAATQIKDLLIEQGVAADKIVVSGIPVRKAFDQERWHWDEEHRNNKNILIMGGGLGMGSIRQSLALLDQLSVVDSFTVVTGYNYDELSKMRGELDHDVEILGYTNQISKLMCRASLLLTKPGALTCTEGAAVQVPMVLYSPIPGQEEANAKYMQAKGCAAWVKKQEELVSIVSELFTHPEKLEAMSKASLDCHRDGARIIGKEIIRLLQPATDAAVPSSLIYEH